MVNENAETRRVSPGSQAFRQRRPEAGQRRRRGAAQGGGAGGQKAERPGDGGREGARPAAFGTMVRQGMNISEGYTLNGNATGCQAGGGLGTLRPAAERSGTRTQPEVEPPLISMFSDLGRWPSPGRRPFCGPARCLPPPRVARSGWLHRSGRHIVLVVILLHMRRDEAHLALHHDQDAEDAAAERQEVAPDAGIPDLPTHQPRDQLAAAKMPIHSHMFRPTWH